MYVSARRDAGAQTYDYKRDGSVFYSHWNYIFIILPARWAPAENGKQNRTEYLNIRYLGCRCTVQRKAKKILDKYFLYVVINFNFSWFYFRSF